MPRTPGAAARKQSLITAATEAIRDNGVGGVRIRDIAARAGMSPAAVLYHYPEIDELVVEVHRAAADRFFAGRVEVLDSMADPAARIVAAIESGLPPDRDDQTIGLLFELHTVAQRSALHAALMTSLWEREELLYRSLVQSGIDAGRFHPAIGAEHAATALIALEDGLALHIVSRNAALTVARATQLMIAVASDLLRCELPAHALTRAPARRRSRVSRSADSAGPL
jgi:AcrR family transcriptional regulator